MASEDYERRRKRLSYDSLREESKEEEEGGSKFVDVPLSLKGHVIGKGGHKLHEIMETTGTTIFSQSKEEAGFTIFGDEEQIAHAERLVKGIVDSAKRRRRELIKVEDKFKGSVKGKEAAKLRHISAQSGAKVILDREDHEIYIISGTEEEREYAKVLIGEIVVGKSCLSFE
ncbi:uncharacterized protein [Porites lutea]|uniref:uncharacterized protein n=1 Tax=Porites lutea TaxID=51062 RepID=UPI003CC57C63